MSCLRAGFSIECLSTVTCLRFGCNLTLHLARVKVGDSLETDNDSMVGVLSIHLNCTDKARAVLAGSVESDGSNTESVRV